MIKIILTSIASIIFFSQSLIGAELTVTKDVFDGRVTYRVEKQKDEVVNINGENFRVILKDINDFRCPPNVMCFNADALWEGAITVDMDISQNDFNQITTVWYRDEQPTVIKLPHHKLIFSNIIKYDNDKYQITLIAINCASLTE